MSDPTKPVGSPFPSGPSQAGSPFPSGPPPGGSPFPNGSTPFPSNSPNPYAVPVDTNIRKSQGWGWNPLIGITYNGFPVGIVIVVIVGLLYLGGR